MSRAFAAAAMGASVEAGKQEAVKIALRNALHRKWRQLEIEDLTPKKATKLAKYLATVLGKGHARQWIGKAGRNGRNN